MRIWSVLLLVCFTYSSSSSLEPEPRIEMALARESIGRGDCQLLLVTVVNPTDKPLTLDWIFKPVCFGPAIEMKVDGKFEQVMAMGQGGAKCGGETTTVPARESISELMELALQEGWYGEDPLFQKAGKYVLRARVGVGGAITESRGQGGS